jgi:UDP:flavonoid glycosyltransferase YjiC (YdhE family)
MSAAKDFARPKILLATFGSLGDLHPFLALALALQARGVRPLLATHEEYRAKVEAAGVAFHAMRPSFAQIEADLGVSRAELTARSVADPVFLIEKLVLPYVAGGYADFDEAAGAGDDADGAGAALIVTSTLAFGARLVAEKRGIPRLSVVLQPMLFLSAYDPPVIPHAEFLDKPLRLLGPGITSMLFRLGKRATLGIFAPLARLRAELGLPSDARHPLFEGQFSATGALGLYSRVLGAVQPDFPPRSSIVGFACFDSADGGAPALAADLSAFLDAGTPPLVFTLGSTIVNHPGVFYRESIAAARQLRRRAVLLVGDTASENHGPPAADLHIAAYAPHSKLFPRAAAVVHQAGIGTLAQGLRAGRPQLLVPYFADQQDNAARARRLGVARELAPARYTAARAAAEIGALLGNPAYAARAAAVSRQLATEDGAAAAAERILTVISKETS